MISPAPTASQSSVLKWFNSRCCVISDYLNLFDYLSLCRLVLFFVAHWASSSPLGSVQAGLHCARWQRRLKERTKELSGGRPSGSHAGTTLSQAGAFSASAALVVTVRLECPAAPPESPGPKQAKADTPQLAKLWKVFLVLFLQKATVPYSTSTDKRTVKINC